jgi:hypothetical protein
VKTRVLVCLLAVAAILVAAGCGGKSRNKAYAGSKADYAAALDQICSPAFEKTKRLQPKSLPELITNVPKIKDIARAAIDKIDKLEPPPEVKSAAEDFVSKSRDALDKFDDIVSAARSGDGAKVQQIGNEIQKLDNETDQDAREIGAQKCVSPE